MNATCGFSKDIIYYWCVLYYSTDFFFINFGHSVVLSSVLLHLVTNKQTKKYWAIYAYVLYMDECVCVSMLNSSVCRYEHECNYVYCSKFSSVVVVGFFSAALICYAFLTSITFIYDICLKPK